MLVDLSSSLMPVRFMPSMVSSSVLSKPTSAMLYEILQLAGWP